MLRNTIVATGCAMACMGSAWALGDAESDAKIIGLTASMNEMALACGELTAQSLPALQAKQRKDNPIYEKNPAQYRVEYDKAREAFLAKWKTGSAEQRQKSCVQIKQQSAATAAQMAK